MEACAGADCKSPVAVLHKAGESEAPRYTGEFTPALVQAWAAAKALPLVIKFG